MDRRTAASGLRRCAGPGPSVVARGWPVGAGLGSRSQALASGDVRGCDARPPAGSRCRTSCGNCQRPLLRSKLPRIRPFGFGPPNARANRRAQLLRASGLSARLDDGVSPGVAQDLGIQEKPRVCSVRRPRPQLVQSTEREANAVRAGRSGRSRQRRGWESYPRIHGRLPTRTPGHRAHFQWPPPVWRHQTGSPEGRGK